MPPTTSGTVENTSATNGDMQGNLNVVGNTLGFPATDPRIIVTRLISSGLGLLGILVLVMILISGFQFMTSGGDAEKVASAKKSMIGTVVGLLIILSAYSIVAFLLTAFNQTGSNNQNPSPAANNTP